MNDLPGLVCEVYDVKKGLREAADYIFAEN
jgi:hypothetical protein